MKKNKFSIIASTLAGTLSAVLFLYSCATPGGQITPSMNPGGNNQQSNPNQTGTTNTNITPRTNQVDRLGLPSINIVMVGYNGFTKPVYDSLNMNKEARDAAKDKSNTESPTTDVANYRGLFATALKAIFKRTDEDANAIATALTPDVYTMDISKPASFAALNGRLLSDDVVDVELKLLSGNKMATDGVNNNDKGFSNSFPFVAKPF